MNDYDACKALLKIMDEAYGAPVVTSFPEDRSQVEAEQLNESFPMGVNPVPTDETNVTYTQTKNSGEGQVTVSANAKSMEELHQLLAMAGLDPSGADKHMQAEPEEQEVCPQCGSADCECEPGSCDCEPEGEKQDLSYSTDKAALVDMIKQKLQQKLG